MTCWECSSLIPCTYMEIWTFYHSNEVTSLAPSSVQNYPQSWFRKQSMTWLPSTSLTCSPRSDLSGADVWNVPRIRRKGAFSYCGSVLWNELPADLRSITSLSAFKNRLKTFFILTGLHSIAMWKYARMLSCFTKHHEQRNACKKTKILNENL